MTPWWADGIYGAELWALLNAAQVACPGSTYHVDCKAVQQGTRNGTQWAQASARKLGRAWIPLSLALEGYPDSVVWMPAHCTNSAAGSRVLSDGRLLSRVDIAMNDLVDSMAKREASAWMPSKRERQRITEADSLIVAIATWIGHCTVYANRSPFEGEGGKTFYRRDSSAVRSDRLRVQNMGPGVQKLAIKRTFVQR